MINNIYFHPSTTPKLLVAKLQVVPSTLTAPAQDFSFAVLVSSIGDRAVLFESQAFLLWATCDDGN
jgi:hypothetical protein